ncbi:uncharacterized protein LOC129731355 [Wyeomyia smithii]|uniref:uncharacterized protein LOC129731355 n=1 Tax=Wyeomyia smithii TaxID=174621 RepID=UPI00246811C9|nr:uncharacterized protein LOC129731355 [Wyeomyia smithii]
MLRFLSRIRVQSFIQIKNGRYSTIGDLARSCSVATTLAAVIGTTTTTTAIELLAAARIQFSGQPNKDVRTKFINFQKGETINPYRTEKVRTGQTEYVNNNNSDISNNNTTSTTTPPHDSLFELDPMRPAIVRLTQQSTNGDGRFFKAGLRDPNIMKIVRLYLTFMNDQQPTVCVDGYTTTIIRILLAP